LSVKAATPAVDVTLEFPRADETVSGLVPLVARADGPGVTSIQFQVSGGNVGPLITSGRCVASWDTTALANGRYTLEVFVRDVTGRSFWTPPTRVTVLNQPKNTPTTPDIPPGRRARPRLP
jgi:hypothetical protein